MLKPVDLQTIMPRSMDIQRMQQVDQVRPVADQQEMSREAIRQTQLKQEQVHTKEAPQDTNIIKDEDYGNQRNPQRRYRRYQKNLKKTDPEDADNQAVDAERGQHIDFKV